MKPLIIKLVSLVIALFSFSFLLPPNMKLATFKAIKMISYTDTLINASSYTAITMLYETPTIVGLIPYKTIQDGVVKLNSRPLLFNQTINMYIDTALRKNLNSVNWSITNAVSFSNINYSTQKTIPTFTNITCIPKNLSKSHDYIMNFGSLQNVDKIEFTIDNGQLMTSLPFYRKVPANINCLTIPKNHLTCLNNCTKAVVRIAFINEEEVNFGNKTFVFENRLEIIKQITITN